MKSLFLFSSLLLSPAMAQWPEFRGPTADGLVPLTPEGKAVDLPVTWEEGTPVVTWKTPIEGKGHSSPAIAGDQIWVTSATEDGHDMFAWCLDRKTGKVIHQKKLFHNETVEALGNGVNNYASPSPVIEEGRVYVHFGSYGTACLDSATGSVLWERRDLPCRHYRGPGSSPVLWKNLLILTMDGVDVQYMVALDKATGKDVWKTGRSTEWDDLDKDGKPYMEGDIRKAYSTPILVPHGDGEQLVSIASRNVFGYEPATGKELWSYWHGGFSNAVRPLVSGGQLFVNTGYSKANLHVLTFDPARQGKWTEKEVVWQKTTNIPNRSTGVVKGNRLYQVDDGGIATCLDTATGEELWKERLKGKFSASVLLNGDHLYFLSEMGEGYVVKAADTFEIVATNQLAEGLFSSPAVSGSSLILRTAGHVYCLTQP
jgi:outer membrane protein assembly factor BamB